MSGRKSKIVADAFTSLVRLLDLILWGLLTAALITGVRLFVLNTVLALQAMMPLDYGEGPLLNQARWIATGHSVYSLYRVDLRDYPYTIANYPPLYPLTVSLVGRWLGFSYNTGRIVSVIATIGCVLALTLIVFQAGRDWVAAITSGALFLACPVVVNWSPLGRVDMMALAFSLWGIFVALRWPHSWKGLGGSLLLLLAAIFTRQSYLLAAPLAVVAGLATQSRRRGGLYAVTLGSAVFLIGGFLVWKTHGGFWFHTVTANMNALDFSAIRWILETFAWIGPLSVIVFGKIWRVLRTPPQDWPWAAIGYLIGGFFSGLTVLKVGSNYNYLLEWVAAVLWWAGVGFAHQCRGGTAAVKRLLLLLLAFQGFFFSWFSRDIVTMNQLKRSLEPEVRQLEEMVRNAPGPVLADEMMSVVVVCGRDLMLQPFEFTRLALEGKWDQHRLVADIAKGAFALILASRDEPIDRSRWTPEMQSAILRRYEPVTRLAITTVYRPLQDSFGSPDGFGKR